MCERLNMLSYMLPVEEKSSQNTRNLSLNLNLQNTTQSHTSPDADQHYNVDIIDENTQLLAVERQDYMQVKLNGNGNLITKGENYNMNITNNNLCNNSLIGTSHSNNNSIIKNSDCRVNVDDESGANNENSVNNNDETNTQSDKKIVKMTKLGSKSVTLKR